jgi:hypothetical protein
MCKCREVLQRLQSLTRLLTGETYLEVVSILSVLFLRTILLGSR